jgi:predicted dehydrogenase
MSFRSRRQFLEESMLGTVAAMASLRSKAAVADVALTGQSSSPAEKLGVAVVGVRHRGTAHIAAFTARKDTEILWVADVDQAVGEAQAKQIERLQGRRPQLTQDMRRAFEDPAVDIVSIATPNHWHALASIWAIQHGKDVYVEKPVSHNVSEGRRIVDAARKHNRIVQTGTQSRSMTGVRDAMKFLHDGKLGKLSLARGLCYKSRPSIGPVGAYAVPSEVNYDLWLGPAPEAPLTRSQFHYDWHWQWPYGNGDLGNQGIHQMDVARWGLGLATLSDSVTSFGGRWGYEDAGETPNTQIVVHDYGDKTIVFEVRGLKTSPYKNAPIGVIFEGSEGYMVIAAYDAAVFDKEGKIIQKYSGGEEAAHYDNFVRSIRSRDYAALNADILEGHISSSLCHLGNTSYRLGEEIPPGEVRRHIDSMKSSQATMETFDRMAQHLADNRVDMKKSPVRFGATLSFDPSREEYLNNPDANQALTREYRAPYSVPAKSEV